jgi:predicted HTH domain antitoxin
MMKTVLSNLDGILVRIGKYENKSELITDALRALLRAKPELRRDVAVELYKKKEVSLSRAAEICGLDIENFKELLKERGVKIPVPSIPVEAIDKEVERILEMV